ncbi:MAG: hypothetical protein FWH03_05285 [Firmicutes bacterium]|nr:hypothetical protein [Bacillota bacterium]
MKTTKFENKIIEQSNEYCKAIFEGGVSTLSFDKAKTQFNTEYDFVERYKEVCAKEFADTFDARIDEAVTLNNRSVLTALEKEYQDLSAAIKKHIKRYGALTDRLAYFSAQDFDEKIAKAISSSASIAHLQELTDQYNKLDKLVKQYITKYDELDKLLTVKLKDKANEEELERKRRENEQKKAQGYDKAVRVMKSFAEFFLRAILPVLIITAINIVVSVGVFAINLSGFFTERNGFAHFIIAVVIIAGIGALYIFIVPMIFYNIDEPTTQELIIGIIIAFLLTICLSPVFFRMLDPTLFEPKGRSWMSPWVSIVLFAVFAIVGLIGVIVYSERELKDNIFGKSAAALLIVNVFTAFSCTFANGLAFGFSIFAIIGLGFALAVINIALD